MKKKKLNQMKHKNQWLNMNIFAVCYNIMLIGDINVVFIRNTSPNVSEVTTGNPVLFTNVSCSGNESHVLQCNTIRTGPSCSRIAAISCFG